MKTMKTKKRRTIISILLLASLLGSVLSGCGGQGTVNTEGGAAGESGSAVQADGAEQAGLESGADNKAMGRYVENTVDISELSKYNAGIYEMADGSLRMVSNYFGIFKSEDKGNTWEFSGEDDWYEDVMKRTDYIMSISMAPDNTAAVIYNQNETPEEDAEASGETNAEASDETDSEEEDTGGLNPRCVVYKPDGTVLDVDIPIVEEEDIYAQSVWTREDGRIFVTTLGQNVYEVFEDGSSEKIFTAQIRPQIIAFVGERLIYDGYDTDGLYIYNLTTGQHEEDQVLNDFVNEYYGDRNFNGDSWYDMFIFAGKEEDVLYIAGAEGLHRHVMGGSSIEQVINGKLSSFNNPSNGITGMASLENNEFAALFSSEKVVRFTYDPDVPSVPDETLKVYSLEENSTLRQAVTLYQAANPEVFVEYEIGIPEEGSTTREDALKKLNTEIIAGEGPDVLVLDNMPMSSYMEKGYLLDVSGIIDEVSNEDGVFRNITDVFEKNGAVYAVPCEFQLPIVGADKRYTDQMKDLEGIADSIEQIRKDNPGKDLLGICEETGIMKLLSMVCAPSWQKENGELDTDALGDFLTQTERIYQAQMDGISEDTIEKYKQNNERLMQEYGMSLSDYDNVRYVNDMYYVGGLVQLMMGTLSYPYLYSELTSVQRAKGFEDNQLILMNGQCSNIFLPKTIAGISASSANTEQAKEFLRLMLGKENQSTLYYGFAVNQAAFDKGFVIGADEVDESGVYGGLAMSNDEGLSIELAVYWVDEEQIETLKQWVQAADTPYIYNSMLEEAVCAAGTDYMQGKQSLEDAINCIEEKVAIYMAE